MKLTEKRLIIKNTRLTYIVVYILSIVLIVYLGADVLYRTASVLIPETENNAQVEDGDNDETASQNTTHAVISEIFDGNAASITVFLLSLALIITFTFSASSSPKTPFSAAITALTVRASCQAVAAVILFAVAVLFPDNNSASSSGYLVKMISPTVNIISSVLEYTFALVFVCVGSVTLTASLNKSII